MDKYEKLKDIELNFMEINGTHSNLWVFDLLGFVYAHLTDEQVLEMHARSKKVLWEHQQYLNNKQELDYELSEGK